MEAFIVMARVKDGFGKYFTVRVNSYNHAPTSHELYDCWVTVKKTYQNVSSLNIHREWNPDYVFPSVRRED